MDRNTGSDGPTGTHNSLSGGACRLEIISVPYDDVQFRKDFQQ